MSLFSFKKGRNNKSTSNPKTKTNKKTMKQFIIKAIGVLSRQNNFRDNFEESEYNLEEIKAAAETDSYIKIALMKYSYLLFKAGYDLKGSNDKAIDYLKKRFRIISFATRKPIDILFQEIGDDLITYSNAFLSKTRSSDNLFGMNLKGIYDNDPIGGYFRLDPITISIERDINGTIIKYKQTNNSGDEVEFDPTDVIHIYIDKSASSAFGTPRIESALEDVKLLRKLEGNVIALVYRFAIPIYQWIIGKSEKGLEATQPEIDEAERQVSNMSLDGTVITNDRTQIKAIGAEGHAIDITGYLSYFEKRVFAGLNISESQIGRGSAKQDADSMEEQTHDIVKYIQKMFSIFIREHMLNELLLEGGFNPILNKEDIVDFVFNEISTETKVKVENAEIYKYQSNVITFEEVRHAMGLNNEVDENDLYANKIENKTAIDQLNVQGDNALKLAQFNAANSTSSTTTKANGNGTTKSTSPNKTITNNQIPENQYGKSSVKIKESMKIKEKINKNELKSKKVFSSLYVKYKNMCNDIIEGHSDINIILALGKDSLIRDFSKELKKYSFDGIADGKRAVQKLKDKKYLLTNTLVNIKQFEDLVNDTINQLLKDIKKDINNISSSNQIQVIFDKYEYRIKYLINYIIPKVYWYSFLQTGKTYGIKKAFIDFKGSKDSETHNKIIDLNNFSIDDIPAFHAFCDCEISFEKVGDKK